MEKEKIERINFLAAKAKKDGLSEQEVKEQQQLRQEYVQAVKSNLRADLENTYIVDEDGRKTKIQKKI